MSDIPQMPFFVGVDPGGKDKAGWSIARSNGDGTFRIVDSGFGRPPVVVDLPRDQWSEVK